MRKTRKERQMWKELLDFKRPAGARGKYELRKVRKLQLRKFGIKP